MMTVNADVTSLMTSSLGLSWKMAIKMILLCGQVKMELEVKVSELERLSDQRRDVTEEIEAFSTQELSNVKQLVC